MQDYMRNTKFTSESGEFRGRATVAKRAQTITKAYSTLRIQNKTSNSRQKLQDYSTTLQ
jgi:hypothetical protein